MPITTQNAYATILLALVTWREARGEGVEGQRGVIWTVLNRAAKPSWWGHDIVGVITQPFQYSSFNPKDPNAVRFPMSADPIFKELVILAADPGADPTDGATHYFDKSLDENPPGWASTLAKTCDIGGLHFYK